MEKEKESEKEEGGRHTARLRTIKGRWLRKTRGVGEVIVIQVLYGIVAIEGYFEFERVHSL
jgi:hypothetical protein